MAFLARSLGRSASFLARRGPLITPVRQFSATPRSFMPEDPPVPDPPKEPRPEDLPPVAEYSPDLLSTEERARYDMLSPEERQEFDEENRLLIAEYNDPAKRAAMFSELDHQAMDLDRKLPLQFSKQRLKSPGLWAEDETDEFCLVEDGDEEFNDDEMTSMAYAQLEEHRDIREYTRIAAWDMPSLIRMDLSYLPSGQLIMQLC